MKRFLLIYICLLQVFSEENNNINEQLKVKIDKYLNSSKQDKGKLKEILQSGSINGIYKTSEVFQILDYLENIQSQFIQSQKIGETFQNRDLKVYFINRVKNKKKSIILFTGAHHAREMISSSMIIMIFLEILHSLIHKTEFEEFWKYNEIAIIPIVNLDSHQFISDSYNTENWENNKMKRKNMNNESCNQDIVQGGVDLNRNYGYHYGQDQQDGDSCSQTFRGESAFSEKETQAVKNFVEQFDNIKSAMNFHSYGNMWIHPFNYMKKKGYPKNLPLKYIKFYENFKEQVHLNSTGLFGNAIEMVNYATDGEASDWMLGEQRIISFSPELGSLNKKAQTFYPPKDLIFDILQENYKVIKLFLNRNIINLNDITYQIDNHQNFSIELYNSGLSTLYNPVFVFKTNNISFLRNIYSISFQDSSNNINEIKKFVYDPLKNQLSFSIKKLENIEKIKLIFKLENVSILKYQFEINMIILMQNNDLIDNFKLNIQNKSGSPILIFTFFTCGIFIALLIFMGCNIIL